MIKLEVINSPDLLSIGMIEYNFHHITIGRSLKNVLVLDDSDISKEHGLLRLSQRGLILECDDYFLVNDKRVSGTILIQPNDTFQFGETKIRIHHFDINNLLDSNEYYNYIEKLEETDKGLANLISALEEEFIFQASKDSNVLEE